MTLLVVQRQVGPLLGVPVGSKSVLLSDAKMRHITAVLIDDFSLGIVQTKAAVLDAELPAAAHGPIVVLDAEGLAFGHAYLGGLVATGTDGVVDAGETRVADRGCPVSVRPAVGMLVGDAAAEAGRRNAGIGIGIGGKDALGRNGQQRDEQDFHTSSTKKILRSSQCRSLNIESGRCVGGVGGRSRTQPRWQWAPERLAQSISKYYIRLSRCFLVRRLAYF